MIGNEQFDAFCIFANKMLLDASNIICIKDLVASYGAYPIMFYIYKLNSSTVNKTSKMVIILKLFYPFFLFKLVLSHILVKSYSFSLFSGIWGKFHKDLPQAVSSN